jgi:hypothetical protein
MRIFLRHNRIHLAIGLILFILSLPAFWILNDARGVGTPVVTGVEAVQAALDSLRKNNIAVDILSTNVVFFRKNWLVAFFVDPANRPAEIWISVNPISGHAEIVPLK